MTALAKIATIARVRTFTFSGIEAVPVEVQVQISGGMPALLLVGLPDKAVGEARERMRAALSAIPAGASGVLQIERDGRLMYVTFEMD